MKQNCATCSNTNCYFYKYCSSHWKSALCANHEVLTYSAGDYIYTAGQPVEGLYVVLSGEAAEGFLVGAFFGEPEHISSEGELLGYTDFTGDRYLYSAKALTDNTKVCMFDKASILDTCRTNKNFSFQLLRFYQDTLKEQEARQFARIEKGNL